MKFNHFSLAAAIAATLIAMPAWSINAGSAPTKGAGVNASSAASGDIVYRKQRKQQCDCATETGQPGEVVQANCCR